MTALSIDNAVMFSIWRKYKLPIQRHHLFQSFGYVEDIKLMLIHCYIDILLMSKSDLKYLSRL